MTVHKSAGIVLYRLEDSEPYYLLLNYGGFWDYPKGHIEKGENLIQTAKRETAEETGIKQVEIIPSFKETLKYFVKNYETDERELKFATFFIGKTKVSKVKLSYEHEGYTWLPYDKAHKKLTFKTAKDLLKNANKIVEKKEKIV